jgi:hypothetical protein
VWLWPWLCLAAFTINPDMTIVNIALPSLDASARRVDPGAAVRAYQMRSPNLPDG